MKERDLNPRSFLLEQAIPPIHPPKADLINKAQRKTQYSNWWYPTKAKTGTSGISLYFLAQLKMGVLPLLK